LSILVLSHSYLTDYRKRSLKDVITQLEPGLFNKVTGLDVKDFELLCSIGVFNASLMNDAIFKFKRYEDASLVYTGIDKHESDEIGGWDTVIRREEYEKLFYNQQATMDAPESNESPADTIAAAVTVTPPKQELVTAQYGIPTPDSKPKKPSAPAKPEVESFDVSKVKVGVKVSHKMFGVGTIVKKYKSNKYVIVHFKEGKKQFLLPDAFTKGFLYFA